MNHASYFWPFGLDNYHYFLGVSGSEKSWPRFWDFICNESSEEGHVKSTRPDPDQNGEKHPGGCRPPLHRQVTLRFSNRGKIVPYLRFLTRRRFIHQTFQRDHVHRRRCQILLSGIGFGLRPSTQLGHYLQRFETGKVRFHIVWKSLKMHLNFDIFPQFCLIAFFDRKLYVGFQKLVKMWT